MIPVRSLLNRLVPLVAGSKQKNRFHRISGRSPYFCREFEQVLWHVFQLDMANAREDPDHNTEKEHGTFSNEKTMLCNMIITVAHKIYLDRYFSLLRDEDTI